MTRNEPTRRRQGGNRRHGARAAAPLLAPALVGALTVGALAIGTSAAAEPDAAAEGQVVLELSAAPPEKDTQSATFSSPHGHATLRIHPGGRSAGQVRINGDVVPQAAAALARGTATTMDISDLIAVGENTVEVRLVRGDADVSVDFPELVDVDPAAVGIDPERLTRIDAAVQSRLGLTTEDRYTGAVALVAHQGQVIYEEAFGAAQTHDGVTPLEEPRPTTVDTIFDMASITKVQATTAAVMTLVDQGRLALDARLDHYLPQFDGDHGAILVRQLLTHRSGLWEWQPTYLHGRNGEEVLDFLTELDLRYEIGSERHYSDLGFMLLGAIVDEVTGQPLDRYLREQVYGPLGMTDTSFLPDASVDDRIAATSLGNSYEFTMIDTGSPYPIVGDLDPADFTDWREHTLVGEVNDGNSWYGWQGVAGHAGLFSTARDVAIYGQTLVNGGGYADAQLASATTVEEFLSPQYDDGQVLGFWSNRLSVADAPGGFGHNGFTGTEFLFDPESELVVVLLTNRLHPDRGPGSITDVWQEIVRTAVEVTAGTDTAG